MPLSTYTQRFKYYNYFISFETTTMKEDPVTFSECFWRFIKEKVGITRVYPSVGSSRQQKTRKATSFEERHEKVTKMLQKTDFDDDKMDQSDTALSQW